MNTILRKLVEKDNAKYTGTYLKIDNCIEPLVNFINQSGFATSASCGSHLVNGKYSGTPYVLFYMTWEQMNDFLKLKKKLNVKKFFNYNVTFNLFNCNQVGKIGEAFNGVKKGLYACCILNIEFKKDLFFSKNLIYKINREKCFADFYTKTGIEFCESDLIIEEQRETYGNTEDSKFTVFNEPEKYDWRYKAEKSC